MNLSNKTLFILVEGDDDERFFDTVIRPMFAQKYDSIIIRPYACWKRKRIVSYLRGLRQTNAPYLFVVDMNSAPCVTQKKQEIRRTYKDVDEDRIIVVMKVIESWYLAGLHHKSCESLGVPYFRGSTETVAKEEFNRLMTKKKFDPRRNFMVEILKCFSPPTAKRRNRSFRYLIDKHDC